MPLSLTRPPSRAPRDALPAGACVFCDIVAGRAPATVVADAPCARPGSGGRLVAFLDARPAARAHVLVVPAAHVDSVYDLHGAADAAMLADMVALGRRAVAECVSAAQPSGSGGGGAAFDFKSGFHYPPLYSVGHLHLHAFALPHADARARLRFLESPGPVLWFATPDQVARRVRARKWEAREG